MDPDDMEGSPTPHKIKLQLDQKTTYAEISSQLYQQYARINTHQQHLANFNVWIRSDKPSAVYRSCQKYLQQVKKNKKNVNQPSRQLLKQFTLKSNSLTEQLSQVHEKINDLTSHLTGESSKKYRPRVDFIESELKSCFFREEQISKQKQQLFQNRKLQTLRIISELRDNRDEKGDFFNSISKVIKFRDSILMRKVKDMFEWFKISGDNGGYHRHVPTQTGIDSEFIMYFEEIEKDVPSSRWEYRICQVAFKIVGRSLDIKNVRVREILKFKQKQVHPTLDFKDYFSKIIIFKNQEQLELYRSDKSKIQNIDPIWKTAGSAQEQAKYCREVILKIFTYIEKELQKLTSTTDHRKIKQLNNYIREKDPIACDLKRQLILLNTIKHRSKTQNDKYAKLASDLDDLEKAMQERKIEANELQKKLRAESVTLTWMNQRLDTIMESFLKILPDCMDDIRKYGFINDYNVLTQKQTKINLHYFKTNYAQRIIEILRNYFENKFFAEEANKGYPWTGWILVIGSVGNHPNWEPRLLNEIRRACEKEGLNSTTLYKTEKNQDFGSGLLVQFPKKGFKKNDGSENQLWDSYYIKY